MLMRTVNWSKNFKHYKSISVFFEHFLITVEKHSINLTEHQTGCLESENV